MHGFVNVFVLIFVCEYVYVYVMSCMHLVKNMTQIRTLDVQFTACTRMQAWIKLRVCACMSSHVHIVWRQRDRIMK